MGVGARIPVIGAAHPGPAHLEHAEGDAVLRERVVVVVDDLHLDAEEYPSLLDLAVAEPLRRLVPGAVGGAVDGAERRHLGHAPGMAHLDAVAREEGLDHRPRRGRAADHQPLDGGERLAGLLQMGEQAEPHRRHPGRDGDPFILQQLVDRGAVGERAGEHQLRPHHRGEIGEAPGVDVEHRHHRHGGVGGGDVDDVGQRRRHRMQDGRAVAVEHALGIARGARGIAERGRGVLVEGGPFEILRRAVHQRLETERAGQGGLRHVGLVGHDDEVLDRLELACELLDQGHEGEVEHQHPVLAVVDDIDDLRREQARVDGVADRPRAGGRVVDLEMAPGVPGERADPVGGSDAEALKRVGEPPGAAFEIGIAVAVDRPLDAARDHLGGRVVGRGVPEQGRDQELRPHHQTVHRMTSFAALRRITLSPPKKGDNSVRPNTLAPREDGGTGRWSMPSCRNSTR